MRHKAFSLTHPHTHPLQHVTSDLAAPGPVDCITRWFNFKCGHIKKIKPPQNRHYGKREMSKLSEITEKKWHTRRKKSTSIIRVSGTDQYLLSHNWPLSCNLHSMHPSEENLTMANASVRMSASVPQAYVFTMAFSPLKDNKLITCNYCLNFSSLFSSPFLSFSSCFCFVCVLWWSWWIKKMRGGGDLKKKKLCLLLCCQNEKRRCVIETLSK